MEQRFGATLSPEALNAFAKNLASMGLLEGGEHLRLGNPTTCSGCASQRAYMRVLVQYRFSPLAAYRGLPSSTVIAGSSTVRVQQ